MKLAAYFTARSNTLAICSADKEANMARNVRTKKAPKQDKFSWGDGDAKVFRTMAEARAQAKKDEERLRKAREEARKKHK